jgi:3-oxoacyl-[acyl-carrier protein] reductase
MDLGISGKRALVLAGGGGLGGASARALANEGAIVAVADHSKEAVQFVADEIVAAGGRAVPYFCDLGLLDSLRDLHAAVVDDIGHPDIIVNITGGPPQTPAVGTPPEKWSSFFDSMVRSVIFATDLVLPAMRSAGWGRIITSTSSGIVAPIPDLAISNALRLTLLGWSKTLAREVARDGVTANVIVPGRIATKRITSLDQARADAQPTKTLQDVVDASTSTIPVGRYGTVEEYSALVAFLAGNPASYITGSAMRVDGGLLPSML